jgi:asparagine synthase (glutamine-hydrolysing)
MCGIFGAFAKNNEFFWPKTELVEAFDLISHRGPDFSNYEIGSNSFIGHKRLSIIDITENGNQPFASNDGKVKIIFNGEIYNYKALKEGLKAYNFRTNSDTEVIIAGYISDGDLFFEKLRGMYAFCILDERDSDQRKLLLVRDPSGIKPLYYYFDNNKLIFESEIKSIKSILKGHERDINFEVMKYYISLGYCPDTLTIYKNVYCLKVGEVFHLDLNSFTHNSRVFYNHFQSLNESKISNKEKTEFYLENAIKLNSVSDVPVTYALSGGVDSSLIVAISQKLGLNPSTLTVSFQDLKFDESKRGLAFSEKLGVKNQLVKPETSIDLDLINKILDNFDQPYSDTSAIPFYLLTKESRKISKVLIGGDGGDEIHNGYPSMNWLPNLLKYKPFLKPIAKSYSQFDFLKLPKLSELIRVSRMLNTHNVSDMICIW